MSFKYGYRNVMLCFRLCKIFVRGLWVIILYTENIFSYVAEQCVWFFLENYAIYVSQSAVYKIMTQSPRTNISQSLKHSIAFLYPYLKLIDVWRFFHYGMFTVLTFSLLWYSHLKFGLFPHAVSLPKIQLSIYRIWDVTHTIFWSLIQGLSGSVLGFGFGLISGFFPGKN